MPTAVSPSASSRRVTGTTGWSRAANASRDGAVSPSRTGDLQRAVEAGPLAGVAGRALLVDQDEQRVAVAVQPDVPDPPAGGGWFGPHPRIAPAGRPRGGAARGGGGGPRPAAPPPGPERP